MPGIDWIPVLSQIKTVIQLIADDKEGAKETTKNFVQECPVVSQVTSIVQLLNGDVEGAKETQNKCLETVNNVANGIPGVGHIKGGIHYALNDNKGGDRAIKSANRTTIVMAAGALTGGIGAIPAGIAAGAAYDIVDTAVTKQSRGIVANLEKVDKNPTAGNIFDMLASFAGDGLAGHTGAEIATSIANANVGDGGVAGLNAAAENVNFPNAVDGLNAAEHANFPAIEILEDLREATMELIDSPENTFTSAEVVKLGNEVNQLTKQIEILTNKLSHSSAVLKETQVFKNDVTALQSLENLETKVTEAIRYEQPILMTGIAESVNAENVKQNDEIEIQSFELETFLPSMDEDETIQCQINAEQIFVEKEVIFANLWKNYLTVHVPRRFKYSVQHHHVMSTILTQNKPHFDYSMSSLKLSPLFSVLSIDEMLDILNPKYEDDGINADYYPEYEAIGNYTSKWSKNQQLNYQKNQNSSGKSFTSRYSSSKIVGQSEVNNTINDFNDPQRITFARSDFLQRNWLHLRMPREFNYTGAIRLNDPVQGLLHSFLRHHDQWRNFIPNIRQTLSNFNQAINYNNALHLAPIFQQHLPSILQASPNNARNLLSTFNGYLLNCLNNALYGDIFSNFLQFQMEIHQFIQNNLTYVNYIGEGMNNEGRQQVYFNVNGSTDVMVVCVSDELYDPESDFFNNEIPLQRNVRTITTVFFISQQEFAAKFVTKLF